MFLDPEDYLQSSVLLLKVCAVQIAELSFSFCIAFNGEALLLLQAEAEEGALVS